MSETIDLASWLSELADKGYQKLPMMKAEAEFGWMEIAPFLQEQRNGLEIGAGSGLLALRIASTTEMACEAIEPVADGFSHAAPLLDEVIGRAPGNLSIYRIGLDEFTPTGRYDLIWSVNVFEHLPDWRNAIRKTHEMLETGGKAVLLFPNHDFPYESHFGLPLIFGKSFTRRLFARSIDRFEQTNSIEGLWDSLNMIRASEVGHFCRREKIDISFDRSITARMFSRAVHDEAFRDRHSWIAALAKIAQALRIPGLWSRLPPSFQPYSLAVITRS